MELTKLTFEFLPIRYSSTLMLIDMNFNGNNKSVIDNRLLRIDKGTLITNQSMSYLPC